SSSWQVLQSAIAPTNIGTALESNPVTYTKNLSTGTVQLAFVQVNINSTTARVVSVADGSGNQFRNVTNQLSGNDLLLSVWMLATPVGVVGTKPTITATTNSPGTWAGGIIVQEIKGILPVTDNAPVNDNGQTLFVINTGNSGYRSTVSSEYLFSFYVDD